MQLLVWIGLGLWPGLRLQLGQRLGQRVQHIYNERFTAIDLVKVTGIGTDTVTVMVVAAVMVAEPTF